MELFVYIVILGIIPANAAFGGLESSGRNMQPLIHEIDNFIVGALFVKYAYVLVYDGFK